VQASSIDQLHSWVAAIRDCSKPIIAAVEGPAAGAGFSLALACDLVVAAESAKFVMAYVKVGLTPDGGGSWFLSQALPRQLATEILLEGQAVTSARLHQAGVVNRVVADGAALDEALKWSAHFATLSPNACASIKSLLHDAPANSLSTHFNAEKHCFVEALHHRDGLEGITAFLEKRKANYT
jgi:enoyl-CoA hydratase/carnithine racemase